MKSLKSYLLIAVLSLSTVFVPSAFANATQPVKGIDVIVKKGKPYVGRTSAQNQISDTKGTRQHATVNADGSANVNLSAPGKYTITYADGPMKGQVIESFTATKAGRHHVATNAIRTTRNDMTTTSASGPAKSETRTNAIRNIRSDKTTTSPGRPAKSETRDLKQDTKVDGVGTTVKPRPSHSASPEASVPPKP